MRLFYSTLCALLLVTGCSNDGQPTSNGGFDYTLKPGTTAWAELKTHDEMVRALQIPTEFLQDLSTEQLVDLCLAYPLLGDIRLFNNQQFGFDMVASRFNGLLALLERPDAGPVMLRRYEQISPLAVNQNWDLIEKGDFAAKVFNLELFLAQPAVIDSLSPAGRGELVRLALRQSAEKEQLPEVFSHLGQESIALLVGRTMKRHGFLPFQQRLANDEALRDFVDSSTLSFGRQVVVETLNLAKQFIEIQ